MKSSERVRELKKQGTDLADRPDDRQNWEDYVTLPSDLHGLEGLAMDFAHFCKSCSLKDVRTILRQQAAPTTPDHEKAQEEAAKELYGYIQSNIVERLAFDFINRGDAVRQVRDWYIGPAKKVIDNLS